MSAPKRIRSAKKGPLRRKHEIIAAAAAVFSEKGYAGTTTQQIAERLGIQQGSLYYYFRSKEEALEEVCMVGVSGVLENATKIAASQLSAADKVRQLFLRHLEPVRDRGQFIITLLHDRRHMPAPSYLRVRRVARRYERLVEGIFESGVKAGEFSADLDCRLTTLAFLALCNAVPVWYGRESNASIEQVAEVFSALLLRGVLAVRKR